MPISNELSDEELQSHAAAGNSEAEDLLIRRYARVVKALARPFFLAGADSEDLIQEGMLGLLSALRSYNSELGASFKTYSHLCIRRRLISAVRSASYSKNVSLDDCLSLESPLFDDSQPDMAYGLRIDSPPRPEELVIDKENTQTLFQRVFDALSKYEQQVLRCYLSGMSYREIAEMTEKPEKAVDNAVQRIRRKVSRLD
jgi:RNA polymerase sporulation-specific sigma factor